MTTQNRKRSQPRVRSGKASKQKGIRPQAAAKLVRKWRLDPHLPSQPNVKLVFIGLMIFCYNDDTGKCEVAFHRDSLKHDLRIQVFKDCKLVYNQPVSMGAQQLEIGIQKNKTDVSFYYVGSPDNFDKSKGDTQDFRWLLDLEGEDFFGAKLDKVKTFFKTKLYVEQGTFYTVQRTKSKFKVKGGKFNGQKKDYITRCVAARIVFSGGDCLSFKVDGSDLLAFPICADGSSYEIYFLNECENCGNDNDFHFVFDALKNVPGGRFDLELDGAAGVSDPLPGLRIVGTRGTDAAPCMGAGFGQSGGFPPQN